MIYGQDLCVSSALDYASGTADRTGTILDMSGFEGVLMIVKLAAVATGGTNSIKAQSGAALNLSDVADLTGSSITIADDDDNQIFVLNIVQPRERYVRLYVDKDTSNAMAESAVYVQYGAHNCPKLSNVTNYVTVESHIAPVEGTA